MRSNSLFKVLRWIAVVDSNVFALQPEAGLSYEYISADLDHRQHAPETNEFSEGYFLDAAIGLNAIIKNLNVGVTFRHPLRQYYAAGLVTQLSRFSVSINYLFKPKNS